MSIFNKHSENLGTYFNESVLSSSNNIEIQNLKDDVELLLDVIIAGRRLTGKELVRLTDRHHNYIFKKFSLNMLRKSIGLKSIKKGGVRHERRN